jgi:hypothetical protein
MRPSSAAGNATTIDARRACAAAGTFARAASIAVRIWRARRDSSTASAFGLATVSISVAVSPKSLMNSTGPAPGGRSRMPLSLSAMSSHSLAGSVVRSSSAMITMDTLLREVDSIRSTREFSAIRSSILRVTSCSTRSALAPGHAQTAAA